ncbi:MAG: membrane protein insertion efficiency factor YidD [Alphaproteobacteria bacterium]
MRRFLTVMLQGLVRGYQLTLSPLVGWHCRFQPTCSHYALQALQKHGPFMGSVLAAWRILRCNPWGGCGMDAVPNNWRDAFNRKKPQ